MADQIKGKVGAVVLAAGKSSRMGQPKLVLSWGKHTVIEEIVSNLNNGGIYDVTIVTGGARRQVEAVLQNRAVKFVNNSNYECNEMFNSLQIGIQASNQNLEALLVVLGDQPSMQSSTIEAIVDTFHQKKAGIVIPSYQMRRGHPWLIEKSFWDEIIAAPSTSTLREFLDKHQNDIVYTVVDTETVLLDIDTPEDYRRQRPSEI